MRSSLRCGAIRTLSPENGSHQTRLHISIADDDFSHVTAKVVDYDGVGPHNVLHIEE